MARFDPSKTRTMVKRMSARSCKFVPIGNVLTFAVIAIMESTEIPHIPYAHARLSTEDMQQRSTEDYTLLMQRRSVRQFSSEPIPMDVLRTVLATASSAPSGAHKQPWTFCLVTNPDLRRTIRLAAEKEEHLNYGGRMSDEWLKDLEPLRTNASKPFLEEAPALVVLFKQTYGLQENQRSLHYYVNESVGIAAGFFISSLHRAGLCTLTHTPSPMNFLEKLLHRPPNEKAYLLMPVGYPAADAMVPKLERKGASHYLVDYP
jgi:iodotyrosine deiodinase